MEVTWLGIFKTQQVFSFSHELMPGNRDGRQLLLQDAEFSVLDTCALFTLLLPTLPQLCTVTVQEPIWLLQVPCKT